MMPVSQCDFCKHYIDGEGVEKCKAFPDGIPGEIIYNKHDHKFPYPGDNGKLIDYVSEHAAEMCSDLPMDYSIDRYFTE